LSWQQILSGVDCKNIYFHNNQIGWAIIDQDSIIYTVNGGINWSGQICPNSAPVKLNTFKFNNQGYGICVGAFGHIRIKENSFEQWEGLNKSVMYGKITDIHVLSEKNVWLCGVEYNGFSDPNMYGYEYFNNVLLHTGDGGENWEKTTFLDTTIYGFTDIFFLNPQYGWVTGVNDYNGPNVIMHTPDGGATWQNQNCGLSWIELKKIFFIDSLYGWIIGSEWSSQGILFSTQDGGNTWQYNQNNFPFNFAVQDIYFIDRKTGWTAGFEGANSVGEVYSTHDGGKNWQLIRSTPTSYSGYCYVQFFDSLKGYIIYKENYNNLSSQFEYTDDGGNTWHSSLIADYLFVENAFFMNESNGWVIGSLNGYVEIYQTNNGGITWSKRTSEQTGYYHKIAFANSNTGWLVGGSVILKTTNGGVSFVEEEIEEVPTEFLLSQNYPNPFNPTTKISWQSPVSSWQTLKIYDVLGNIVATLVNEHRLAGNYKVDFNASNLPSGVYFYQLQAGIFVETKKLLFLK